MGAENRTLGIGIVGTGIMARVHAAAVDGYFRSRTIAFAARSETSATDALEPDRVVRGVDALLEIPEIEAVVIATPDHLHAAPAIAALEAGKHVLIEKPLATSPQDARRIRDAARSSGVVASTLFNHRWVPAYWQTHMMTKDSALGSPVLAYARKNDTIEVPTEMIRWSDQTSPSYFLSSHDLDLILWFFDDRVVEVFATAVHGVLSGRGIDTPDAVHAQLRLSRGAVVTLEACWILPNTFPTMTDSFIELVFSDGVVRLDRIAEQIVVTTPAAHTHPRNQLAMSVGGKPSGSVSHAIRDFVDAVLDSHQPLISIDSSVHVTDVLTAIDASWRTGSPVELNTVEME